MYFQLPTGAPLGLDESPNSNATVARSHTVNGPPFWVDVYNRNTIDKTTAHIIVFINDSTVSLRRVSGNSLRIACSRISPGSSAWACA